MRYANAPMTNMHAESSFSKLKRKYLGGKANRRLDDLIKVRFA